MTTYREFVENRGKIQELVSKMEQLIALFCSDTPSRTRFFNYVRKEFFFNECVLTIDDDVVSFSEPKSRRGTFFFGNPLTNDEYPWPQNEKGEGLIPLVQVDLPALSRNTGKYIDDPQLKSWLEKTELDPDGPRYLQLWSESLVFTDDDTRTIRLIPNIQADTNEHNVPTTIAGEINPNESSDWFNEAGLRVRFVINPEFHIRNGFELFNYQEEFLVLVDDIDWERIEQSEKYEKLECLEDSFRELLEVDDLTDKIKSDNGHFYGCFYPISGCFTLQENASTVHFLEKGWRLFLQFPEDFYYESRPNENGEIFPKVRGWSGATPAVFYRFKENDEPEFMAYYHSAPAIDQHEAAHVRGDEIDHQIGINEILNYDITIGSRSGFDIIINLKRFNHDEMEDLTNSLLQYCNSPGSSAKTAEYFLRKLSLKGSPEDFEAFLLKYFGKFEVWDVAKGYEKNIHKELLKVLLDIGVDKSFVTFALCEYIETNGINSDLGYFDEDYLSFFLENGADPNLEVESSLHGTADATNPMVIALGLVHSHKILGQRDRIEGLVYPLLKFLIKYGGDPRIAIESYAAVGGGLIKCVSNGINFELKPNYIGRDGETDVTREMTNLWFGFATVKEIVQSLAMLKDAGADFNIANKEGDYPINKAIESDPNAPIDKKQSLDIVLFLLKSGVDLTVENSEKQTILMQAISESTTKNKEGIDHAKKVIELLINYGASAGQKSSEGLTVYDTAATDCPRILPWLRKLNDREPESLCETILFKGQKSLDLLKQYIDQSSETEKSRALAHAIRLRYTDIMNYLLSQDIEVLAVTSEFKTVVQVKTKSLTYPLPYLNFFSKSEHQKLGVFWQDVLATDTRDKAKNIALQQLEKMLGKNEASLLLDKTEKDADEQRHNIKIRTKAFTDKLQNLLSYLLEHDVLAYDIHNNGYAPSGAGIYLLDAIDEALDSGEINRDDIEELRYCWFDLKLAKDETKQDSLGFGPMLESVESIYVYYDAETTQAKKETAELILEAANHVGLTTEWNGEIDSAILLSCQKYM